MSVNAETCPHCGETDFYRVVPDKFERMVRCPECEGKGTIWLYRRDGHKFDSPFPPKETDVTWTFEELGVRVVFDEIHSEHHRNLMRKCLRSKDYKIERWRDYYYLYYDEDICPKCDGDCKIKISEDSYSRIDIRKPVL